ncbi:MAG TPA: TRAP transporter substrate-binding protein [Alphaproteobacteria bacterium]|nr:TRAP transporter substrate-binding protein [Alphaproteobacteria bacterium]
MLKRPLTLAVLASMLTLSTAVAQEIRVGLSLPQSDRTDDFVNGMYEVFEREVEAHSDMTVEIAYGGALGAPNERLNQMRRGVIQMSDAADGNIATIYRDIQIVNLPYLFPTEEAAWKLLDGPIGQRMAEEIREETGIRVLGWWESGGFKHYSANRPIEQPEDMHGLKMRVLGPLATIPVEALGGSAAPIAFGELYTALRTGVVDGQDNSVTVFNLVKLYEVQSHLSLTGHTYAFGPLGINDAFFSGLSEEQQTVIENAADAAIAFNRKTSREAEATAIAFAKEQGTEVTTLDPEAREAFKKVVQPPAIEWLRANVDTPDLIDEMIAAVSDARD